MRTIVSPARVVIKALIFFLIANVLFALIQPSMGKLSIYNWLVPGRERFPFEEARNIDRGHNLPIFEDLDALFSSHKISDKPKDPNEYRVILLGDSSIWGYGNTYSENISAKLNELGLYTCDGRQVQFYNLGYPKSYLLKDLLILEKALPYRPDMILWFFTLYGFTPSEVEKDEFLAPHVVDINRLESTYQLRDYTRGFDDIYSFMDGTIIGQREILKRNFLLQLFALPWAATGIDHYVEGGTGWKSENSSDPVYLNSYHSSDDWKRLRHTFMFDVLDAGQLMAQESKVIFINEPIFADESLKSTVRYNSFYPKWAYDMYREDLTAVMKDRGYLYIDMWDAVDGDEFSDSPLHLSPNGEHLFAQQLAPFILEYSCVTP